MQVFLSEQIASITGKIGTDLGYAIRRSKHGFYGYRCPKCAVPPDGHWRFIVACAELAQDGLHIADIQIKGEELNQALKEAGITPFICARKRETLNARRVLHFKSINSL